MTKPNKEFKPVIKEYLSFEQTLQFLNHHGLLNYSVTDLYELAVEERIVPVFLVDDIEVGYLANKNSEIHLNEKMNCREWFRFSGYCQLDTKSFLHLSTTNEYVLLEDLVVYKPFKKESIVKNDNSSDSIQLAKGDILRFKPVERTIFDDSKEEVRELLTDDYTSSYAVQIEDIRFPLNELEQLLSYEGKCLGNDLTDKTKKTYLLLIGTLHYLLNKKKGVKDAPYATKSALVIAIEDMEFETTGLKKSNLNKILKEADAVYEDLKKKI